LTLLKILPFYQKGPKQQEGRDIDVLEGNDNDNGSVQNFWIGKIEQYLETPTLSAKKKRE